MGASTIRRVLKVLRIPPAPKRYTCTTWRQFPHAQAAAIRHRLPPRGLRSDTLAPYCLFAIEPSSRYVHILGGPAHPGGPWSPARCRSPANGTCCQSSPSTPGTTTDDDRTAAASSARPGPTTPSQTSLGSGSSARWRRHQRIRTIRAKDPVKSRGRVLEPQDDRRQTPASGVTHQFPTTQAADRRRTEPRNRCPAAASSYLGAVASGRQGSGPRGRQSHLRDTERSAVLSRACGAK